MDQTLHNNWWRLVTQSKPQSWRDSCALGLLRAASCGYSTAVSFRNACYDLKWLRSEKLAVPVISIGNLTVGGTGKTTCVEFIARKLVQQGRRPAVLSRGYGGTRKNYWLEAKAGRLMVDRQPCADSKGLADEPQLLALALEGMPVGVGANRWMTGQAAAAQWGADVVLLDDGLQHRGLHRDFDIALVHARTPFSGFPLLPRGPMREPLAALKRAQAIIITKADEAYEKVNALKERLQMINPDAIVVTSIHEPTVLQDPFTGSEEPIRNLEGKPAAVVSSIGDPEGFETLLKRSHADILWHQAFPDHHPYTAEDAALLVKRLRQTKPGLLVTTTKDWVRLKAVAGDLRDCAVSVRLLRVAMKIIDGESKLDARLDSLFAR